MDAQSEEDALSLVRDAIRFHNEEAGHAAVSDFHAKIVKVTV